MLQSQKSVNIAQGNEDGDKDDNVPHQKFESVGHRVLTQGACDLMDLVRRHDEDEWSDDHVEDRVTGNKDQDSVGVRRHPDVVLADE